MPKPSVAERIEVLEQRVEMLESLPATVAEIKTLCEAIRADTESFRNEIRAEQKTFRKEIRADNEIFRREIRAENEIYGAEMRSEFASVRTDVTAAVRESQEETRRQMRMLHEEVISRIARIDKG
jgi:hypothetical protein